MATMDSGLPAMAVSCCARQEDSDEDGEKPVKETKPSKRHLGGKAAAQGSGLGRIGTRHNPSAVPPKTKRI